MSIAIPRVVIVGGGFAGLETARRLRRANVDITLIDRRNHHLFQPLLYQVATAGLSPGDIAEPIRRILRRQQNLRVLLGEVTQIDREENRVWLADGEAVEFDYLVVATGSSHNYFGNEDRWQPIAPALKTLEDAIEIRRRFLEVFEDAERELDPERCRRLLTFVIVGAGATGVELAGTMSEMARQALPRDFRRINDDQARIVLLEATDRVLPPYPPFLSRKARRQLEKMGVEVRTETPVKDLQPGEVHLEDEVIECANIFWAAGVQASPLSRTLGAPTDKAGLVEVEDDLSLPGASQIFIAGDLAHVENRKGELLGGTAQAAIQMGRHVARAIEARQADQTPPAFSYKPRGRMATLGRAAAVAEIGPLKIWGWPAWLLWLGVHLYFLVGFQNRLLVFLQWFFAYIGFNRGARLITDYAAHR